MKNFFLKISLFAAILSAGTIMCLGEDNVPKLTNVVLYKNGLGYFQMSGQVENNGSFQIPVKDTQINDILSSLYALDLNGGKITTVNYEINKSQNNDILIKLPQTGGLKNFLKEIKGAEIEIISSQVDKISGKLIGIEPIEEVVNNSIVNKDYQISLLGDDNCIHPILLSTVSSYKILNKSLQNDLNKLLDLALSSKYQHRKIITVNTEGKGIRNVVLGYLLNTPVWKTTYRIIFSSKYDTEPLILGYALAENVTENDWNNVKITFVAGAPLSFIMNLSEPFYVSRPNVPIPGLDFLNVNWNKLTGSDLIKKESINSRSYQSKAMAAPVPSMELAYSDSAMIPEELEAGGNYALIAAQSNQSSAIGEKIGETFTYNVNNKISVLTGQAAMIPIISEKIKGDRIYYFNKLFSDKAANAFAFKNETNITFDSGPVTFFQNANNLGEGIIKETLVNDSLIVIPYSIANSVILSTEIQSSKSDYIKGSIVNGFLRLSYTQAINTKWNIQNKNKKTVALWIDQPINSGYNLELPKSDSIVSNCYRFKVDLKPQETTEFKVKEIRSTFDTISLINANESTILLYAGKSYIDTKDREILRKISILAAERAKLQNTVSDMNKQIKFLSEEQIRLRQNVTLLNNSRNAKEQNLRIQWVDKIAQSEENINKCQFTINQANDSLEKIREEINKLINKI